ncbi:BON domain-containing protein [Paraburkholderia sediminicola]|uniref:BON domain-containing protein n=1 Tax=Paraburkholderia sediminicola TaxID=458836 RepID=UPI0038B8417F
MNAIKTLKVAGVVLVAFASVHAWAQESGSAATSTATQSTSQSSVRKVNRTLSKAVIHALSKGGVDTMNIRALTKNGAVTLAGSVADPSQIDKAGSITGGVAGVASVKNDLETREVGH